VNSHDREIYRYCHQIQRYHCVPAGSFQFTAADVVPLRFVLLGTQSKHRKIVHTFLFKNVFRHVKGVGKYILLVK
jgi:hypothetical protein